MKMSDATKMAVALARKGASDDVIALVMETMATHREHIDAARSAAMTASPAALETLVSLVSRSPPHLRVNKRYAPLLAAMRADVVRATNAGEKVVTTLRRMTAPHEALLRMAAPNHDHATSLRGLASLIGNARWRNGGVVGGMKFTATGDVANHQTNYVYTVEAV